PEQSLAVQILLQNLAVEHRAKGQSRTAHRLVGRFIDDMQRVVQTTGVSRSAVACPVLRRLAALPTARGETQNLAGHATTLQSCRNHFARQKRDLDRLA